MRTVIGLVGENGAGKTTFIDIFRKIAVGKSVARKSAGDGLLAPTLKFWCVEPNRMNLQKLGFVIDKNFGTGTVANVIRGQIEEDASDIIVFDGVRQPVDVDMIRRFPVNFLVYITAHATIRYERMKTRNQKPGEQFMTFERFLEEEKSEIELRIPVIGESADVLIQHNESLRVFRKAIAEQYHG